MKLLHVCNTAYTNCGIGNFSINFHGTLERLFPTSRLTFCNDIREIARLPNQDVIIYHHEFSFEKSGLLSAIRDIEASEKVAFIHSDCKNASGSKITKEPDAYITMCKGMINTDKPVFYNQCPGYYDELSDRKAAREKLGLPVDGYIIGTFSMLGASRRTVEISNYILDKTENNNVKILILASSHESSGGVRAHDKTLKRLNEFGEANEKVIFKNEFLSSKERNLYMQACDLIWCYSSVTGAKYASASCSDVYCSGTKVITNDCPQHHAIAGLKNVITCPDLKYMLDSIVRHADLKISERREPFAFLSFGQAFNGLDLFIEDLMHDTKDTL